MFKFYIILILSTFLVASQDIMTESYPPYSYEMDGEVVGLSTQIVKEIQKRVGSTSDIKLLPWTRAYEIIQKKPNKILYSMAKTDARKNLFKWVGPIAEDKIYFFKKRGSDIDIKNLNDAREVKAIGVGKNSSGHIMLTSLGFRNLDPVVDSKLNIRKLMAGRVDLVPSVESVVKYRAIMDGINPDMIENTGVSYHTQKLYIAFSKDIDNKIIEQWQNALDKMKADGSYKKIRDDFMHSIRPTEKKEK